MSHATSAPGWPVLRGIQTVKDLAYEVMFSHSAAAALNKLWADTFLTNAGIYAAGSAGYTYQGTPNFNVIRNATGAEVFQGKTATADSGANPSYVTDGNISNASSVTSGAGHWVKIDLATAKIINRVGFYTHDNITYAPKSYVLQGSNNDTDWTDIYTEANLGQSLGAWTYKDFTNTIAYRYYRFFNYTANSEAIVYTTEIRGYEAAATTASIVSVLALDLAANITQAIMFADVTLGTGTAAYYVSTDDGSTWTAVALETLASVPAGKKIRIKVELTGNATLNSWGVAA